MIPLTAQLQARLEGVWSRLTQPSDRLKHPEHRHKARFLASALLLMGLWQFFISPLLTASNVTEASVGGIGITLLSAGFLLGSYVVTRSGYYKIASLLVILYSTATIVGATTQQVVVHGAAGINTLYYMALVTLFFGLFASLWVTVMVVAIQLVGLGVLLFTTPQVSVMALVDGPGGFIALASFMLIGFVHYRNQLERLRRQTILDSQLLQVALGKERELSALKTNLMMTISHEFRTPLTVIGASQELLEHYYERLTDEKRLHRFRLIGGQVKHMTQMLDEITLVMQVLNESIVCRPAAVNLEVLCQTILDEAKAQDSAAERSHTFALKVEDVSYPLWLDPILTSMIIKNLLSNAMKYSPENSEIRLEAAVSAAGVTFTVIDHGDGIPDEDKARMFEPFYRGSNVGTIKGIGMGLTIVEKYVNLHRGTLTFDIRTGQGTTVQVFLPT